MTTPTNQPTAFVFEQAKPPQAKPQATPASDAATPERTDHQMTTTPREDGAFEYTPFLADAAGDTPRQQDWTIGAYPNGKQYHRLICATPTDYDSGINGPYSSPGAPGGENRRSDSSGHTLPRRELAFTSPASRHTEPFATNSLLTSTPLKAQQLQQQPQQDKRANNKKGRNKSKNARKNARRQSEAKRVQPQSSDEEEHGEEQAEFEVFIAVPEKRTAELIGKQGTHIKKYWNDFKADVTIIPGIEWDAKVASEVILKRDKDTGIISQHVFRIEAYNPQEIISVISDMKDRFWKFDYNFLTPEAEISEDFFADYFHDGTYYAKSHFLQPKPGSKKKYNQKHTGGPSGDSWINDKFTEDESIARLMGPANAYEDAMPNSGASDSNWRSDNTSGSRKKGKKGKKGSGAKNQWPRANIYCKCSYLKLDKRMETPIYVCDVMDEHSVWIQQPTHPSFQTLQALEYNIWHTYSKYGLHYDGETHPGMVSRKFAIGNTWCVVPDPYFPSQNYRRAKVEHYNVDDDIITVSFCDYGGFQQYPRCDVYNALSRFLELPFQATLVQMVDISEEDQRVFNHEAEAEIAALEQHAIHLLAATPTPTKSAGEQTSTSTSSDDKETDAADDTRLRSSTVLGDGEPLTNLPVPLTSVRTEKIKYNALCPKTLSYDEPAEVHTDISLLAGDGGLFCEVVKDVEDLVNGTNTQHIRLFRYDLGYQKIYIDFRPPAQTLPTLPLCAATAVPEIASFLGDCEPSPMNASMVNVTLPESSVDMNDPESMQAFLASVPQELILQAQAMQALELSVMSDGQPMSPSEAGLPLPVFVNESFGLLEESSSCLNASANVFVPRF